MNKAILETLSSLWMMALRSAIALALLTTPVVSMPVVVSITLILGGVALGTTGSRDERD